MPAYDDAVAALYQAPFADFVAERKRLAAELKTSGDKAGAAALAKLPRPPISAWTVNQLWWRERAAFEELTEAAARVRVGDREASRAHREALARLRDKAARLLSEAGNAASEATLRRVTTTLSAIAAQGSFEPDRPGTLSADRDPPGFEALGFGSSSPAGAPASALLARPDEASARHAAEAERRRAAEEERRRAEAEAESRRRAERERLMARLRETRALHTAQQREVSRLKTELDRAERSLKETQTLLGTLEDELGRL